MPDKVSTIIAALRTVSALPTTADGVASVPRMKVRVVGRNEYGELYVEAIYGDERDRMKLLRNLRGAHSLPGQRECAASADHVHTRLRQSASDFFR